MFPAVISPIWMTNKVKGPILTFCISLADLPPLNKKTLKGYRSEFWIATLPALLRSLTSELGVGEIHAPPPPDMFPLPLSYAPMVVARLATHQESFSGDASKASAKLFS